jgi:hypothetical protein
MATVKSINGPRPSLGITREQYERLSSKLIQLKALLTMTHGNAGETFNDMSDEMRDNYLWACASMAGDCEELAEAIGPRLYHLEAAEACHG